MATSSIAPPALPAALGIATGIALGWYLTLPLPVGAACLVALLGVATGSPRWGHALLALGLGALAATGARERSPIAPNLLDGIVTVEGRVCGHPRDYPEGGASLPLCAELLRRGTWVRPGRWELRLDLAPGIVPPALGARVRARGPFSRASGYDNADRSPPGRWALRVKASPFLRQIEAPPRLLLAVSRARGQIERLWRPGSPGPAPGPALARALVLGDAHALPRSWLRALRRTGLAHLVAVSGFHVALVGAAVLLLTSPLPRGLSLALGAAAAASYLALVGPEPSIVRATWMACAVAGALFCRRAPSSLQALALVAGGMLLWRPEVVDDLAFRLSVAATAGLLALGPRIEARLRIPWVPVRRAVAASLGAQIAALPFAVAAFGRLAPAAALWNLLFVPVTALGLGAGLASAGLAIVWDLPAGRWLTPLLEIAALPFRALTRLPPSPLGSVPVPGDLATGALLALLAGWLFLRPRWRAPALLTIALLVFGSTVRPELDGSVELALLDVGQGDAILLDAPPIAILVDGGGARGRDLASAVLLPALSRRGISRLAAIVLTHADRDHCGGLADLAGWLEVGEVWLPVGLGETSCTETVRELAPVRWLEAGDRIAAGRLRIEVLHPGRGQPGADNAVSLVLAVEGAGRRVLLTGDLDSSGELALAPRLAAGTRFDLLKVAHHGSATSSTPELLAATRPRLALLSAGARNPYGHPAQRTLERLARVGIPTLRTDRDGEISVRWRMGGALAISLPGSPRRGPLDSRR
ncbi:MAG: DNA internalization-related competence protein ComEC/Rec2 [Holophagales bacterium]|nr:DNA internalization-related competence protein ComEC/Rec2 [Holophagales bacterium]